MPTRSISNALLIHRKEFCAYDDLLFVIVQIPNADRLSDDRALARCMLQSVAILAEFAAQQQPKGAQRKSNVLLERYPWLWGECRQACPTFGNPVFSFKLPSRVLQDGRVGTQYRYVIAFPRKEFR